MSDCKETTTEILRTLLNDYKTHNPTLDLPTLSLQIIHLLSTEIHRLQSVITNLQQRVRHKSQRAFIRFNQSSAQRVQEYIIDAHITNQSHLKKHDQSAHVAFPVANVTSKKFFHSENFSTEKFKSDENFFNETVTETALHPPVNSTQSVSQQIPPHAPTTYSTQLQPLAYALEMTDNEADTFVSSPSNKLKVSEVKKGSSPSSRPEFNSEELNSMETRKGSYSREDQGLETDESKVYRQQVEVFDEAYDDNDSFLKGTVLTMLDQVKDMPDLDEFECLVEGLRDFLLGEHAIHLLQDVDIMARLVTLRQSALYEEKLELNMHQEMLEHDVTRKVDKDDEKGFENLNTVSSIENIEEAVTIIDECSSEDTDEAYLSVDSSLLEEDIYLIDEKELNLPETEQDFYHPRQFGSEPDRYGTNCLTPEQMDVLFSQLRSEAHVLLDSDQLRLLPDLTTNYHFYRTEKDLGKAAFQLQSLMDLLNGLTNLNRWIRRVLDGDFTQQTQEIYYKPRTPTMATDKDPRAVFMEEVDNSNPAGEILLGIMGDGFQDLERLTRGVTSKDLLGEIKLGLLLKYGQDYGEEDFHDFDVALTEWFTLSRPDLFPDIRDGKHGPLLPDGRFFSQLPKQEQSTRRG